MLKIKDSVVGKNLIDTEQEIKNAIEYANNFEEHITAIELNSNTMQYLNRCEKYAFGRYGEIKLIINKMLKDNEVIVHREKNRKVTPYEE